MLNISPEEKTQTEAINCRRHEVSLFVIPMYRICGLERITIMVVLRDLYFIITLMFTITSNALLMKSDNLQTNTTMVGLSASDNVTLKFENVSDSLRINLTSNGSEHFMDHTVDTIGHFLTDTVTVYTVDYDLEKEIEYYEKLEENIWKIWSPLLLGKGCYRPQT